MTALDYFVLIVTGISFILGAWRGIVKESISILSVVLGLIGAGCLYAYAGHALRLIVPSEPVANLAGFILIFVAAVVAGAVLTWLLRRVLRGLMLGWVDHLLGAGFGLVRGWLISSVVYLALTAFPARIDTVESARFAPALLEGTRVVVLLTPMDLRERFVDGYRLINDVWGKDERRHGHTT
ncbi:MAG TPA: CvpA family protein [Blastocatellia bacterium]|nr:CvpA family protein [Blastocatellia bacterium]